MFYFWSRSHVGQPRNNAALLAQMLAQIDGECVISILARADAHAPAGRIIFARELAAVLRHHMYVHEASRLQAKCSQLDFQYRISIDLTVEIIICTLAIAHFHLHQIQYLRKQEPCMLACINCLAAPVV